MLGVFEEDEETGNDNPEVFASNNEMTLPGMDIEDSKTGVDTPEINETPEDPTDTENDDLDDPEIGEVTIHDIPPELGIDVTYEGETLDINVDEGQTGLIIAIKQVEDTIEFDKESNSWAANYSLGFYYLPDFDDKTDFFDALYEHSDSEGSFEDILSENVGAISLAAIELGEFSIEEATDTRVEPPQITTNTNISIAAVWYHDNNGTFEIHDTAKGDDYSPFETYLFTPNEQLFGEPVSWNPYTDYDEGQESTIGTENPDKIVALNSGEDIVVIEGLAGNDELAALSDNVKLSGGDGDDYLVLDAGGFAHGGEGADNIEVYSSGEAYGGQGDDSLWSYGDGFDGNDPEILLVGGAGDDWLNVSGENSTALGGDGNDTINASEGAFALGGEGTDNIAVSDGGIGDGGVGDDVFFQYSYASDHTETSTITTGDGSDTIEIIVDGWETSENAIIITKITDFDPENDTLYLEEWASGNGVDLDEISIEEADDGSYSDIVLNYVVAEALPGNETYYDEPKTIIIRLEGVTGFSADQIVRSYEDLRS